MKKIIGLSCGRKNQFCEALLKKVPRFSYEGGKHHGEWLGKHYFANAQ
jgi:hypothetical protein